MHSLSTHFFSYLFVETGTICTYGTEKDSFMKQMAVGGWWWCPEILLAGTGL